MRVEPAQRITTFYSRCVECGWQGTVSVTIEEGTAAAWIEGVCDRCGSDDLELEGEVDDE